MQKKILRRRNTKQQQLVELYTSLHFNIFMYIKIQTHDHHLCSQRSYQYTNEIMDYVATTDSIDL
jgi:hypothetical protein